ncbi:MAG: hypothetical protein ACFFDH_22525 [Promethearchaeota archaeon]
MNEISNNVRQQINVAAYYLSEKNYTYDKLCWMLAERQLIAQRDARYKEEQRKKEKAAEIFFQGLSYDLLTWLIAELDILMKLRKI